MKKTSLVNLVKKEMGSKWKQLSPEDKETVKELAYFQTNYKGLGSKLELMENHEALVSI